MDIPKDTTEFVALCKSLSKDDLQDLLSQLSLEVTNIQVQLDDHVYHKYTTGPNGQPDWEHKARLALRYATWRLSTAQRVLGTKRTVNNSDNKFERAFIEIARALLAPETYQMLVEETKAMTS